MLPIKHSKEPLGKDLEAHTTAFSMQHLGLLISNQWSAQTYIDFPSDGLRNVELFDDI
jgi:hypothetical protein